MDTRAIVIIHFNPIEQYPPVMNLLNYMSTRLADTTIHVFTNHAGPGIEEFESPRQNVVIKRFTGPGGHESFTSRLKNYSCFYYRSYRALKKIHPAFLWYFETLSALPAWLYFRRKQYRDTRLFIHYHEYMSPGEVQNGPVLVRRIHNLEKALYRSVDALSHTNANRMQLFLKDNGITLTGRKFLFPNYPPKSWIRNEPVQRNGTVLKLVYVGAIGIQSLYLREFCDWVNRQEGRVQLSIYSNQDTADLQNIINSSKYQYTKILGSVAYTDLPEILASYDVGLILYKGHIPNYIFNAPNKLFEYWACGLDVWFPEQMVDTLSYQRADCYPKIIPLNFNKLNTFDAENAADHMGLEYKASPYYCEEVFESFFRKTKLIVNES